MSRNAVEETRKDTCTTLLGRKKIDGRKRFIVTDTLGLLPVVLVLPASVQDRDGARNLLLELRHRQLMSRVARRVRHRFADAGFAGSLIDWARDLLKTTIEVVRKPRGQKGFAVIPRRWAVERTFAWLTAYRRLARDDERHPATAEAIIRWARREILARDGCPPEPGTRAHRETSLFHADELWHDQYARRGVRHWGFRPSP